MDVGLVCDSCSTFNPMGSRGCSRCGAVLSLEASTEENVDSSAPSTASTEATVTCGACGVQVGADQLFCGGCGASMDAAAQSTAAAISGPVTAPTPRETPRAAPRPVTAKPSAGKKTLFFGAMQAARAKLVLIKGDGLDGVSFTLAGEDHIAGRLDAPLLFDEDPFLSPQHANFFYRSGELVVKDKSSANGVYIRIRGSHPMGPGDRFLVGEQVLEVRRIDLPSEPSPEPDGTYYYASPRRSTFMLQQILRGGGSGLCYAADADAVSLGREDNDINFPDDPFISGHHAQVSFSDEDVTLTDLGSKNGTFARVNDESHLEHGDYVFMGQQLLRVEIV